MHVCWCWLQEFAAVEKRTTPSGPVVVVTVEPKELKLLAMLLDANASKCQGLLQRLPGYSWHAVLDLQKLLGASA